MLDRAERTPITERTWASEQLEKLLRQKGLTVIRRPENGQGYSGEPSPRGSYVYDGGKGKVPVFFYSGDVRSGEQGRVAVALIMGTSGEETVVCRNIQGL